MLDGLVQIRVVVALGQEVDGTLHPLAKVTVPEQVRRDGPVPVVVVDGVPFQLEAVVTACALEEVQLCVERNAGDGLPPGGQHRRSVEGGVGESGLRV